MTLVTDSKKELVAAKAAVPAGPFRLSDHEFLPAALEILETPPSLIESFPFTRYGTINARVTRVARDAIPQPEAEQTEQNSAKPTRSTQSGTAQRTQNLVFPVTLKPETTLIGIDGTNIPLQAGMATTVEIRTGSRRILEYIFSPLVQIGSETMRER